MAGVADERGGGDPVEYPLREVSGGGCEGGFGQ